MCFLWMRTQWWTHSKPLATARVRLAARKTRRKVEKLTSKSHRRLMFWKLRQVIFYDRSFSIFSMMKDIRAFRTSPLKKFWLHTYTHIEILFAIFSYFFELQIQKQKFQNWPKSLEPIRKRKVYKIIKLLLCITLCIN